ncbi:MAG: 30S ribosomal protein S11 [bacterium]|nr:30S ribosomal protein S11 [bacterium]
MAEEKTTTPAASEAAAPADKKNTDKKRQSASYRKKKKIKKFVTKAIVHIHSTYNNTIVTFAEPEGQVLGWASAGQCGFAGPKKSTPFAAGVIVRNVIEKVRDYGVKEVDVRVKGVGSGREAAIRALNAQGLNINSIKDVTPIPHNGPRPRKARRV